MKIHDIEQRSPEWYALRAGMPTASEFSKLIQSDGTPSKSMPGYALTLAAEMFAGKSLDAWEGNEWTNRGTELEPLAVSYYELVTDCQLSSVGFVTDDDVTMGCSPDALANGDGLVELKCLKAENHIKAILYYQKNGKCPTDYVPQTQGQLWITGRKWCDLLFYHPELPPLIIRQMPDSGLWMSINKQLTAVRQERDRVLAALREQSGTQQKEA